MIDWLDQKTYRPFLFLYGGSFLTALTVVFPQFGRLQWVTMLPMLMAVLFLNGREDFTAKKSYWLGFFTVYLYYFVIYHWFVKLYPMDFVGLSAGGSVAVILAGWLGLSLLQALPGGLIFLFFRGLCKTDFLKKHPIFKPVVFGALWVLFEWSSTLTWTGVPWGRLYMGQAKDLAAMQISSVFGAYFLSFLILLVNGFLAYMILYRRKQLLCFGLSVGLILSNQIFGLIRSNRDFGGEQTLKVAVIQGNIDSHEKWESSTTYRMMEVYTRLTEQAVGEGAELIVWPETAITVALNRSSSMKSFVSDVAKNYRVTLLVGALYEDETGEYNSLFLVTPDGEISEQRYDKRHLVPFGEYVPLRGLIQAVIPPLADVSAIDTDLTAGEDSALFATPWGKIGGMICFDSIYEMLGIDSVRDGANLMVIASNDSWFSDSTAVYQHQTQAQFRAVEEGRYLIRSANTGISTVIAPNGEVLRWLDPLTEGYAVCEVSSLSTRTVYSIIGNVFVYLCGGGCLVLWLADLIAKKRQQRVVDESPS